MSTVKLKGINGEFKIHQENGVFVTLLAIKPTLMGGSLSNSAKVKYSYGFLSCHKNQIEGRL